MPIGGETNLLLTSFLHGVGGSLGENKYIAPQGAYKENYMDIELDAHDLILAAHYAGLIEGVKSVLLKQGNIKNNKISGQTDFGIHYAGMLGEVAVGKTTGIPLHTNITFGGDGNVDMSHKGQTIQIKTSTHQHTPTPRFLIFNSIEDFSTDWAISCSIQGACTVRIHGFASTRKFVSNVVTHDFGYGTRYCMDEKHLTPINRFHEAMELNGANK